MLRTVLRVMTVLSAMTLASPAFSQETGVQVAQITFPSPTPMPAPMPTTVAPATFPAPAPMPAPKPATVSPTPTPTPVPAPAPVVAPTPTPSAGPGNTGLPASDSHVALPPMKAPPKCSGNCYGSSSSGPVCTTTCKPPGGGGGGSGSGTIGGGGGGSSGGSGKTPESVSQCFVNSAGTSLTKDVIEAACNALGGSQGKECSTQLKALVTTLSECKKDPNSKTCAAAIMANLFSPKHSSLTVNAIKCFDACTKPNPEWNYDSCIKTFCDQAKNAHAALWWVCKSVPYLIALRDCLVVPALVSTTESVCNIMNGFNNGVESNGFGACSWPKACSNTKEKFPGISGSSLITKCKSYCTMNCATSTESAQNSCDNGCSHNCQ